MSKVDSDDCPLFSSVDLSDNALSNVSSATLIRQNQVASSSTQSSSTAQASATPVYGNRPILIAQGNDAFDMYADPFVYPIDPRAYKVCGLDEAGRGPLMGDVVAACVILDYNNPIIGLNDSKSLSEKKRDALAIEIKQKALAYGIGRSSPQEIDEINILNASFLAMQRAYSAMVECLAQKIAPQAQIQSAEQINVNLALVDGNKIPKNFPILARAVVKGDAKVSEIAAASILAKTTRDADLYKLDKQYPDYKFAQHKGYPTKAHLELLQHLPLLDCYRMSYGPIRKLIDAKAEQLKQEKNMN